MKRKGWILLLFGGISLTAISFMPPHWESDQSMRTAGLILIWLGGAGYIDANDP